MNITNAKARIAAYVNGNRSGSLYLDGCTGLTALPDGFRINGKVVPVVPDIRLCAAKSA